MIFFCYMYVECFFFMGMLNGIILDYEIFGLFIIDKVYLVFYVCVIIVWNECVFM